MTSNNPNDPNRLTPGPDVRRSDVGRDDLTYNRRGNGSFWPWIIGLIALLAIGWIVIEAFDQDTGTYDQAVPAAGEMRDEANDAAEDAQRDLNRPDLDGVRTPTDQPAGD